MRAIDHHVFLHEKIVNASNAIECDFRFVLRNLLHRAVCEAHARSFLTGQSDYKIYQSFRIYLEQVIADLPSMIDQDGLAYHRHRHTVRDAVVLARYIIEIERVETASQFDMLEDRLKGPKRHKSYIESWAA